MPGEIVACAAHKNFLEIPPPLTAQDHKRNALVHLFEQLGGGMPVRNHAINLGIPEFRELGLAAFEALAIDPVKLRKPFGCRMADACDILDVHQRDDACSTTGKMLNVLKSNFGVV